MPAKRTDLGVIIRVRGIVQGVGFRPFAHRLAQRHQLRGTVWNDADGVVIEVVGAIEAIERFTLDLRHEAPPAAAVDEIGWSLAPELVTEHRSDFRIVPSRAGAQATVGVGPDLATCPECLAEMADPADRRYRYAFTNCTNCGPRLSILDGVPYDRSKTTMMAFAMCAACDREYRDPGDRRFHAQPNACPACGPSLRFESAVDGSILTDWPAIHEAFWELIGAGGSVAIKGVGGYHLACMATDDAAVRRLRVGKQRPHKPLALRRESRYWG